MPTPRLCLAKSQTQTASHIMCGITLRIGGWMPAPTHHRENSGNHISAIRADSLREQVSRALEAALVAGELKPGEIYSAPGLAERFGVSATPVREAMLDLVKDGFVEVVRNKGFRVLEMSENDLDQISQIRLMLEVPSTANAAAVITPEKFEMLAMLAEQITSAAGRGDIIRYLDADRQFHVELIATLGNPRLTELIGRLRRQTRLFGLDGLARSGRLIASAHEHHELLLTLRAGDTEATTQLMKAHIGHTRGLWIGREETT
jgi:DNA-binding GntR family transcriptional regulator